MFTTIITQPDHQLGNEISTLLETDAGFREITFVSAFVSLRTVLRLREDLLALESRGCAIRFIVGIDLGGTSQEVLQELLRWNTETFVFHNAIRWATFHPKVYLFRSDSSATLILGSNNLTEGGFYTNYEAASRLDFSFPGDQDEYRNHINALDLFLNPEGGTVHRLTADLIQTLTERGELPSEEEAKRTRKEQKEQRERRNNIPTNPFSPEITARPPLLSGHLRSEEPRAVREEQVENEELPAAAKPEGVLVWRKTLTASDVLQVSERANPVGGVRLTQARFEYPPGHRINQTTYFRRLFDGYGWEQERGGHRRGDQEHTFVPIHIIIRGVDYGIRNFEISHKPSGEAGQGNYTTILRWGHTFSPTIRELGLGGSVFSLYETEENSTSFLIDIDDG